MAKKYSREQIIQTLQNLSKQLGKKSLSGQDIAQVISPSVVNSYFGSIGNALEAAGLERTEPGSHLAERNKLQRLSDDDLFGNLLDIEREIGKEPGFNDCSAHGRRSVAPYRERFGRWNDVLAHYRKWKTEHPDSCEASAAVDGSHVDAPSAKAQSSVLDRAARPSLQVRKPPAQFYGEPIDFRGLRHAPINEQGVVFLFGMVSRELGFNIEAIQQGFPDCEGKYLHDAKEKRWVKARIEFEYKASSFQEHGHDPEQCDFIVCWINDWPDCPIDVIELKSEILKLPAS